MSSTNDVLNEHFLFLFLMNNFVQLLPHLFPSLAVKLVKLHLEKRKEIHVKLAEPETDFNLTEGASQILATILKADKHVLGIVVYLVGQKSWLGCGPRGLGLGTPPKLSPSVSVLCWTGDLSWLKLHLLPMTDGSKLNRLYWWNVNQDVCGFNLFHPCRQQEWRPGWKEPKGLLWRQGRDRRLWRLVKPPNIPSFLFREHISKSLVSSFCSPKPSLEEVRTWGQSFDKLMCCPAGRNSFRQFLRTEFSEENMLFWLACDEFRTEANKSTIEEKARAIYEDYISILSPKEVWTPLNPWNSKVEHFLILPPPLSLQVSLDSRVREAINRNMQEPTLHTFDDAQLQIYTLMQRDSYPRYMNSPVYKNLFNALPEQSPES